MTPEAFTSESLRLAPSRVEVDARVFVRQLIAQTGSGCWRVFLDASSKAAQCHERRDGHDHAHAVEHVAGGGGEVLADERGMGVMVRLPPCSRAILAACADATAPPASAGTR